MFDPSNVFLDPHSRWMKSAMDLARQAFEEGEVPIGAVIVHENRIIGASGNQREQLRDPTAHAEMIAITQAAESLGTWRLLDCTLYSTLEPCPMCAGAIVLARLRRVIFGCSDSKGGAAGGWINLLQSDVLNHRCEVTSGVRHDECAGLLQSFFRERRAGG